MRSGCGKCFRLRRRGRWTDGWSGIWIDGKRTMKIAISGASGLGGKAVGERRMSLGDEVVAMKRDPEETRGGNGIFWSADLGLVDEVGLEGADAVIHLAGESIAGPWTERRKEAIRESRVRGT